MGGATLPAITRGLALRVSVQGGGDGGGGGGGDGGEDGGGDVHGAHRTDIRFIFPVVRLHSGDAKRKVRTSAATARHADELEASVWAGEVAARFADSVGVGSLSSAWSADICEATTSQGESAGDGYSAMVGGGEAEIAMRSAGDRAMKGRAPALASVAKNMAGQAVPEKVCDEAGDDFQLRSTSLVFPRRGLTFFVLALSWRRRGRAAA